MVCILTQIYSLIIMLYKRLRYLLYIVGEYEGNYYYDLLCC